MDKQITFDSVDSVGRHFAEAIDITPRGGGLEKIAGTNHPQVARYLTTLRPDPRYQYVLMTPMGSYEYWGQNVNGDLFPKVSLSFDLERDDAQLVLRELSDRWLRPHGLSVPMGVYNRFGFKTFLDALRYRHHANKDPSVAYGDIQLSVWNADMQRIEVIARHDREKAKRVNAGDIIQDIDEGKPRQISMGCRVPFDVCTQCGHISRTPRDYCEHLRGGNMGSVNPDGSVNGAVNFFPNFFDLSDVFVPAAKESGVLQKVASAQRKLASTKAADIEKRVVPNSGSESVEAPSAAQALKASFEAEPDIPTEYLQQGDLGGLLTTLAGLGIILKPHEFQRAALGRMGLGRYGDELDATRRVFDPRQGCRGSSEFNPEEFSPRLADLMSGLIPARSALYPHMPSRVLRITIVGSPEVRPRVFAPDSEPLRKIASAYSAYRSAFRGLPRLLDVAVAENPEYYTQNFFGDLLTDALEKSAGSAYGMHLSESLVPLYVYNAYHDQIAEPPPSWELSIPRHSPARALVAPVL